MADVLNETQVAQFQDAFKAVDTDHDGFIASSQLGLVLRSIGQNPTDAEVQVGYIKGNYLCTISMRYIDPGKHFLDFRISVEG